MEKSLGVYISYFVKVVLLHTMQSLDSFCTHIYIYWIMYSTWVGKHFLREKKSSVTSRHPVGKYHQKIKINTGSASTFLKLLNMGFKNHILNTIKCWIGKHLWMSIKHMVAKYLLKINIKCWQAPLENNKTQGQQAHFKSIVMACRYTFEDNKTQGQQTSFKDYKIQGWQTPFTDCKAQLWLASTI